MNKTQKALLAISLASGALVANADYIEIGTEVEKYNSDYSSNDLYLPYLQYQLSPIEGSPWYIEGSFNYSYRNESHQRDANNFGRYEFFTGYNWTSGNLTLKPKIGVRHEAYNNQKKLSEIRIFPQFDYKVTDQTSIYLSGFVAPVPKKDFDRSTEATGKLKSYNDYKHELELGVGYQLTADKTVNISFYNEYNKTNDLVVTVDPLDGSEEIRNEWQLRLAYKQTFDKFSIRPWARIDLYRKKENVNGLKKDDRRHRIGFDTTYDLNKDYSVITRLYIQKENQENGWTGESKDAKYRHYIKLALRRSF